MPHIQTPEFDCAEPCVDNQTQMEMECLTAELIPKVESVQGTFVDTEVSCLSEQFASRQERQAFDLDVNKERHPCVRNILTNNSRFCKPTTVPNQIKVCRVPAFRHKDVCYNGETNRFCGTAEFGAMKCKYECNPDQFDGYLKSCEAYGKDHDCRKTFPQPGYRVNHPDLNPYDKVECALDKNYMAEIMENCPQISDIDDSVLISLEEKLKCLKVEEKIHNAGLTNAEKIALYAIAGAGTLAAGAAATGAVASTSFLGTNAALLGSTLGVGGVLLPIAAATGIVYGVGALIRKIRSEKARRKKLDLGRKEFRRLKRLEKLGKKYGQEDFRITSPDELPADFDAAIQDKDTFKKFRKAYKANLKEFRSCFIDKYGRKAWRKWKRYVKTKNKEGQVIIDSKARAEIAKTKGSIKDREKWIKESEKNREIC
jgi:hypothetical protein